MLADIVLPSPQSSDWLLFNEPIELFQTKSKSEVVSMLKEVEGRVKKDRLFAAGFVSYEAASGFDSQLETKDPGTMPLVFFGLYRSPRIISRPVTTQPPPSILWENMTGSSDYGAALQFIKREIAKGNTYQVNHTVRLRAAAVSPWDFFCHVLGGGKYSSYIDTESFSVVSSSPELFFNLDGALLRSDPMKGTAKRGLTLNEDLQNREWLMGSDKNRAENLMITDMVRNDIGRVANPGSVKVSDLYRIEKFPTVWQAVSTVVGETDADITDIFRAMFPGASVTGAPKKASMGFISRLEETPREIYTGTIGFFGPERKAQFNIAIRTTWIDKTKNVMEYGVGGGIVWDSEFDEELSEIAIKSQVLSSTQREDNFDLLETMRWSSGEGVVNFSGHINRLRSSAEYFDFKFVLQEIEKAVSDATSSLRPHDYRIRLTLSKDGLAHVHCEEFNTVSSEVDIVLASKAIDVKNPFLYHKTTNRKIYEDAAISATQSQEVILFNSKGYVTESTIANLVYSLDDILYTPPVRDGLLPGTMREKLLGEGKIMERSLSIDELSEVSDFFLISSLRGWRRAKLVR
tara:strand:- start:976 stop:2700 length:1725 start_codon:yes stop_codon:yes gene_type:complete